MEKIKFNALIFAAGLGTRLYPLTKDKPKALVEIGGKTLLERVILKLKDAGVNKLVVNVHHFADLIEDFLRKHHYFGLDITISDERSLLLDTGGGLKQASSYFDNDYPVLIHNVDVLNTLSLSELLHYHVEGQALATLCVRDRKTARYFLLDEEYILRGWTNIHTGEVKMSVDTEQQLHKFAFSGIHIVNPEIFSLIEEEGAFSIVDLYLRLAKKHIIKGYLDTSERWMDLGKLDQIQEAQRLFS